mgnify:CR=1 FL=1
MMRIKRRVLVTVLVCALVLAAAGAGSWFYLHRDTGPSEPMCLALTRQDVRPLVGEAESASDGISSEPYGHLWVCSVSGGPMRLLVEASPNAEKGLSHYKDLDVSLLETVTARRGGVSEPVPSIDATVVSWLQGRRVCADWFEGDSAVILSLSTTIPDDKQARRTLIGYFDELTRLLKRRALQLLDATGFAPPLTMRTPSPTAITTDEPDSQTPPPTATATVTGGPSQTPSPSPATGASTPPSRTPAGGTSSPSQTTTTDGRATDGPG